MVTAEEDIYKRWPTRWRRWTVRRRRTRRRTRPRTRTRLPSTRATVAGRPVGRAAVAGARGDGGDDRGRPRHRRRRAATARRPVERTAAVADVSAAAAAGVLWSFATEVLWRGLVVNSISSRTRTCVWSPRLWCTACRRCISTAPCASWSCARGNSSCRSRPRTGPSSAVSATGSCSPCSTPAPASSCTSGLRKTTIHTHTRYHHEQAVLALFVDRLVRPLSHMTILCVLTKKKKPRLRPARKLQLLQSVYYQQRLTDKIVMRKRALTDVKWLSKTNGAFIGELNVSSTCAKAFLQSIKRNLKGYV